MRSEKQKAVASAEATTQQQDFQIGSYSNPRDKASKNLLSRWFSKLLLDAKDEAQAMGNIRYAQYLEGLLRSSDDRMGGEAA